MIKPHKTYCISNHRVIFSFVFTEWSTVLRCLLETSFEFDTAAIFSPNTVALFHWFGYVISFLSCEEAAVAALSAAHYGTSDGELFLIVYTQSGKKECKRRKLKD